MKKQNLLKLFVAVVVLSLAACSGGVKDQIAHKWKLSELKSPQIDQMMSSTDAQIKALDDSINATADTTKKKSFESQKSSTEAMVNMMKQKMDEMKTNSYMEFKGDGTYEANMGGNSEKGKWEVDGSGKWLISQTEGKEKKDSIMIDEVSADKLVLSMDSTSMTFTKAEGGEAEKH